MIYFVMGSFWEQTAFIKGFQQGCFSPSEPVEGSKVTVSDERFDTLWWTVVYWPTKQKKTK